MSKRVSQIGTVLFVTLYYCSSWAVTENISYQFQTKVLFDGSILKKNGGCEACYDSGALSNQKISSGAGYVEFVFNKYTSSLPAFTVVGLGAYNSGLNYNNARYNLRFNGGYASAYLGEAWKCDTQVSSGNTFRISVSNNVITFSKNGSVFCSFSDAVAYPLYFDVMFATSWTNIQNAKLTYSTPVSQASLVSGSISVVAGSTFAASNTTTLVTVNLSGGTPSKVELSRDGYPTFYTWTSAPYSMNWCISSSCFGNVYGSHTLFAKYTMPDGSTGQVSKTMTVTNPAPVSQASLVSGSITVAAGNSFTASNTPTLVTVSLSGNTPSKVELSRDGYPTFYTWTSAPYSMSWCISSSCFGNVYGSHTLYAKFTMPDGSTGQVSKTMNVSAPAAPPPSGNMVTSTGLINFNGSSASNNGSYNSYANPPVGAGNYFNDPAFGTKILRATDGNWGAGQAGCFHIYSYWHAFNVNNTKIILNCNGLTRAYGFDPVNFRMTGQSWDLAPAGYYSNSDGFDWANDPNYPNRVYFFNNYQILYNDVGSGSSPVVIADFKNGTMYDRVQAKNVSGPIGSQILCQLSKSMNDDTFAFHRILPGGSCSKPNTYGRGYVVWRRSNNSIYVNTCHPWAGTYCDINEVHISKTGDYLSISTDNHVNGVISGVMNISNINSMTLLYQNSTDKPEGHYHVLQGWLVGVDASYDNAMHMRNLSNPKSYYKIGDKGGWGSNLHVSGNADNEKWVLVSTYGFGDGWIGNTYQSDGISDCKQITMPFQNEIWQLATDGSGSVRRIAHHMAEATFYDGYRGMPKANISRDGRYVVYSSAWGGRIDVYIAQIPPAP